MADINVVIVNGRLTKDIEVRATQGGTSVGKFSIATGRRRKSGDQWVDETSYIDIVLWGKSVDSLRPYLTKGRQVSVHGYLRQNTWEQDGQKKSKLEVICEDVQLLAAPQGQQNQAPAPVPPAPPVPPQGQPYGYPYGYPPQGYGYPPQGQPYPPQMPPQTPTAPPAPPVPPAPQPQPPLPTGNGPESFVDDEDDIPF